MSRARKRHIDPAEQAWMQGVNVLVHHPLFGPLARRAHIVRRAGSVAVPAGEWAVVTTNGAVCCHPGRRGTPRSGPTWSPTASCI